MSDDDRYRRFNLRIPKDLFERLQKEADARSHSMNAEIVQRLRRSIEHDDFQREHWEDQKKIFEEQEEKMHDDLVAADNYYNRQMELDVLSQGLTDEDILDMLRQRMIKTTKRRG
ncbi:hypothetical protein AA13595_0055 [Gluconacetobacter johannae DSM 13595]|nr:Arc family DNA-binding protein [Gluconacetobacter johannae]GBQ79544.1 hypothetical protein AA13595_0055 [Gluconacetobacter johannae DSM 13595]